MEEQLFSITIRTYDISTQMIELLKNNLLILKSCDINYDSINEWYKNPEVEMKLAITTEKVKPAPVFKFVPSEKKEKKKSKFMLEI